MTRKLDGDGIFLLPHQARLRHGGNHQTNGGRHRTGMKSELFKNLFSQLQGVSLTGNGDSLESDGECKHNTKPKHIKHFRTPEFFSRGSRLEPTRGGGLRKGGAAVPASPSRQAASLCAERHTTLRVYARTRCARTVVMRLMRAWQLVLIFILAVGTLYGARVEHSESGLFT